MENGKLLLHILLSLLLLISSYAQELSPVRTGEVVEVAGSQVSLACHSGQEEVVKLEWRCRGCFSISKTKESRLAVLENNTTMSLIYPDRLTIIRTRQEGFALNIKPTQTGDSGSYFCLVNGNLEPASAFQLAIQDVPSRPGKPLIMKFDSRSCVLSWSPPLHSHHSQVTHYIIHILEGEDTDWDSHEVFTTSSPQTIFNVTDLQPFTVYSFKVTGVNEIGASNESLPSYHMMTLREVPSGKPTITAAHNISSNSIKVSWKPPDVDTINGEFLGYQISWRVRSSLAGLTGEIKTKELRDPTLTRHIISGLQTYTQYLVSLQVLNPKGAGPSSTVVVMTNEGVPSSPLNISAIHMTNVSVTLHWTEPRQPNGLIAGYRLYYMSKQVTDVVTVKDKAKEIVYQLKNIEPYTKYSVWVKAFTWKHEGNSSDTIEVLTDVSGPGRPLITNLTCPGDSSLYVEWSQPEVFYHGVDRYNVFIKTRDMTNWQRKEIIVPPVNKHQVEKMVFTNLSVNQEYLIRVQALTASLYQENLIYPGLTSEAHSLIVSRNCDGILVSPMREEELKDTTVMVSLAIVIGASVVFVVLLIAVMSLAFYRRRKMRNRFYIPSSGSQRDDMPLWDLESLDNETFRASVPSHLFAQHTDMLTADNNLGFRKELDLMISSWAGPAPPEEFVPVNVLATGETVHSGFIVKTFKIKRKKLSKKMEEHLVSVYQYIPSKLRVKERLDFLRLVKHSQYVNRSSGPVLLSSSCHSLTYMAVTTCLQQIYNKREVNLVTTMTHILNQCRQVQDLQLPLYIFIHEVLVEAIAAGNTLVSKQNLLQFVRSMEERSEERTEVAKETFSCWQSLTKQFSVATQIHSSAHQYLTATNPTNHLHNNSIDYVAADLTRVTLSPPVSGRDYINASWVPGYHSERQFIISQHPNNYSIEQFWHMVWQTQTNTIICLSVFQQPFWPHFNNPLTVSGLRVTLAAETSTSGYQSVCLELELEDTKHTVQMIFCPNWPHLSVPVSNCVHLVDCVSRLTVLDKPVMLIDTFGATEAAIFCVLSSLVRMMDMEDSVDVFYWFKSVHLCRVMAELCSINKIAPTDPAHLETYSLVPSFEVKI